MVSDNVFKVRSVPEPVKATPGVFPGVFSAILRQLARFWCGLHGHSIMMHFEPNRLSLECALCGYRSDGWEVGRPLVARKPIEARVHTHQPRVADRRPALHAVPSGTARMAS